MFLFVFFCFVFSCVVAEMDGLTRCWKQENKKKKKKKKRNQSVRCTFAPLNRYKLFEDLPEIQKGLLGLMSVLDLFRNGQTRHVPFLHIGMRLIDRPMKVETARL